MVSELKASIATASKLEAIKAAMKSHEVVGVTFPDSCCSVYRVQLAGTPTIIGGDHVTAEDAQAACDDLNAAAVLQASQSLSNTGSDELVLGLHQLRYVLKSVANGDDQREIMPRCIEIVDAAINAITTPDRAVGEGLFPPLEPGVAKELDRLNGLVRDQAGRVEVLEGLLNEVGAVLESIGQSHRDTKIAIIRRARALAAKIDVALNEKGGSS